MPDIEDKGTTPALTADSRYDHLVTEREPYLRRARDCAELTIPSLLPEEGSSGADLYMPFQSVGARGINSLAAKLLLALFPPGSSFFRLKVDEMILEEATAAGEIPEGFQAEFDLALAKVERAIVARLEQKGVRTTLMEGFKHLLVAGNVLMEILDNSGVRLHFLDSYVVKRDYEGNVLEIVLKETIHKDALPEDVAEFVKNNVTPRAEDDTDPTEDEYDLHTWVRRDGNKWHIHQEVEGQLIPDSEDTDPLDNPRFHAIRLAKIDGEDYSRSLVEEYLGDLTSLEMLTKALVEYSAAVSKIIGFVDPTGYTEREEIAKAPSGAFLEGDAKEVTILSFAEKTVDMQMADKQAVRIEDRLEQAFLLFSSIQRNAERVTAEEIRTVANELEQSLGGIYSILAQELQQPLVTRVLYQMQKSNDLPKLPAETVKPHIVAGLDGLSRSSDLNKMDILIAKVAQAFGPEAVAEYVNVGVYMTGMVTNLGITLEGLVRSEEEVQARRQQAQEASLAEKMGPVALKESMALQAQPEQG